MIKIENLQGSNQIFDSSRSINNSSDSVSLILKDIDGIFPNYFKPFLVYYEHELIQLMKSKVKNINIISIQTNYSCMQNLLRDLIQISIRTLIYEFHSYRELNKKGDDSTDTNYNYYNNSLLDKDFFLSISKKYPVLDRIISVKINSQLALINESLTNLEKDRETIEKKFGITVNSINNIILNSGDSHNGGKSVVIFEINDNERIVYKPHSLSAEIMYNEIVTSLNKSNKLSERINSFDNIDKQSYGWQKYAIYESCQNEKQIKSYFYRIGAHLSIFNILNTEDIHSENIVASGEYPVIFDLETLIKNKDKSIINIEEGLISNFFNELNSSVLGVYLLPSNFKISMFDYDMGGISDEGNQESRSWKSYILENKGTDRIKLVPRPSKISPKNNRVKLNDNFVDPLNYTSQILKGFEESFLILKDHKKQILTLLSNNKQVVIRQVLRATSVYARFLEASLHPKYLKSETDRKKLFEKMYIGFDHKQKKIRARIDSEIEALIRNDIPYFTQIGMQSLNIIGNEQDVIIDYYNISLYEIVKENLENSTIDRLKREKSYIQYSLASTVKDVWNKDIKNSGVGTEPFFKSCFSKNDFVLRVGSYFLDNAIWNENKTKCTWLLPLLDGKKLTISPLNLSLYEGGGILLYLLYLGKVLEDDRYVKLAVCGLDGAVEIERSINNRTNNTSFFTGSGSKVYLYYNFYKITNENRYLNDFKSCLEKLEHNIDEDYDVMSGFTGTLIFLLNVLENNDNFQFTQDISHICRKMSVKLYELVNKDKHYSSKHLCGLGHGLSSLSWALIKSGSVLNENKYVSLGLELIEIENKYYSSELNNWLDLRKGENQKNQNLLFWCHGAPGIGLSRSKVLKYLEYKEIINNDIDNVISRLQNYEWIEILDGSLCHGSFGVFDMIKEIKRALGTEMSTYDKDFFDHQLTLLRKYNLSGVSGNFLLPTFMLGFSGIAYSILRTMDESVPSVLSFE